MDKYNYIQVRRGIFFLLIYALRELQYIWTTGEFIGMVVWLIHKILYVITDPYPNLVSYC